MDDEQGPWWTQPPEPAEPAEPADDALRRPLKHPGLALGDTAESPPADPEPQTAVRRIGVLPDPAPDLPDPLPNPSLDPPAPPRPRYTVAPGVELGDGGVEPRSRASATGDERTQVLPQIPDDIFATFSSSDPNGVMSGPTAGQPIGGVSGDDARGHLRAEDGRPLRESRRRESRLRESLMRVPASPRAVLIGGAGLLVLAIITLVALIGGGGGTDSASGRPTAASSSPSSGVLAATFGGNSPKGLKQVGSGTAARVLAKAGQHGGGSIVEAWTWKDSNGTNLVVSTIKPVAGRHTALQIIHVVRADTDSPNTLRVLKEPSLPVCKAGGTAGFTKNSLLVRDLNGDGTAEISAGWSSRCSSASSSDVKLALITDGKKYIIRGDGMIGQKGSAVPDPKAGSWPPGYLNALRALFHKLYY